MDTGNSNNRQLLREDYRHLQQEDYKLIELMNNLPKDLKKVAQDMYNRYINADTMEYREFYRNEWKRIINENQSNK